MNNATNNTALATTNAADLADFEALVDAGLLTRAQVQALMTAILANADVPGGEASLKATRVARAFLRLAAMAEDAAGYGKPEFMVYASKAFDRQIAKKNAKTIKAAKAAKALPAKVKVGTGVPSKKLTIVKKLGVGGGGDRIPRRGIGEIIQAGARQSGESRSPAL